MNNSFKTCPYCGITSEVENMPLDILNLSMRCYNALRRNGVHSVQDLIGRNKNFLYGMTNVGEKCVYEIVCALESIDYEVELLTGRFIKKPINN